MKMEFKNNFIGYFKFYYSVLGNKIFINLMLCTIVSLLDGFGLAMFMPLLQAAGDGTDGMATHKDTMGELQFLIDSIIKLGIPFNINTVLVLLVLVFLLKGAIKYGQLLYQTHIRHLFMKRMRFKLVEDLQELSYAGFLKLDAGKIQNTLISEVQRLFSSMNFYFNSTQMAVMLMTYITLAFLANYQFAIFVSIGVGLTNLLYRKVYKETKTASSKLSQQGHDFNGYLIQAINHFKYLKATNYFKKFELRLKSVINHTEQLNKKIGSYSALTVSMKEPLIVVVVSIVIYFQITVMGAGLTSILLSLLLFYRALIFLVTVQNHWQNFIQNVGALESVSKFTSEIARMKEPQGGQPFSVLKEGLFLKDVEFSYGDRKVIDKINLRIPKNNTIAFIGESGSGKTTLVNIISSLLKVDNGQLLVDNEPIDSYSMSSYRNSIGYIAQEAVIFNDNIYNNITFWSERTPENLEYFWKVVELAALTPYINSLPEKENTALGDNGILISGGQRQRISIARELFKKAQILILDEATSALDSETEKMIQENIDTLHGSYTMVVIAHRLSTIKNADKIYLLENGRIAASGNFDDMLVQSAKFKRMVALQEI